MSPVWHIQITGVHTLQEKHRAGDITLKELKDGVVDIIQKAVGYVEGDDLELDEALDNIKDATDVADYDEAKDELYDWADRERVWIDPLL
jgi:hypothetical protein